MAGLEFEIAPLDWEEGILLRVDEPTASAFYGAVRECVEDNNEVEFRETFCD